MILLLVDAALVKFRPLQYVHDLRFIPLDQHPMVSKIPVYMESRDHVNYLIMGSSLPMCAIAEYDRKLFGAPDCDDPFQLRRYAQARYIEQQLSAQLGKPVKTANLSIVSCMASDLFVILSKSISAGKKPDAVICCIAPRDFVDNLVQPIGRTPPFEVLQDLKSLNDVLGKDLPRDEVRDLLISAVWYYYRVKVDYRTVFTQWFSNLVNHPTSLYYATRAVAPDLAEATKVDKAGAAGEANKGGDSGESEVKPKTLAEFNKVYEPRYKPPNYKRFALECEFFVKLLALCQKDKIACVVINMPMTASHHDMLDPELDKLYLAETQSACARYGAHFLDFYAKQAPVSEFSDGLHVNSIGSQKFQDRLVGELVRIAKGTVNSAAATP